MGQFQQNLQSLKEVLASGVYRNRLKAIMRPFETKGIQRLSSAIVGFQRIMAEEESAMK